jgi:hypothetical protein
LSELSRYIKIAQKRRSVLAEHNIGWFNVSMDDTHSVQTLKSFEDFGSPLPDLLFSEGLASVEAGFDFISEISSVCQFHNQRQFSFVFVEDGLSILDNVGVVDRGQNSDLTKSIPLIFFLHIHEFDLNKLPFTFLRAYSRPSLLLLTR